MRRPQQETFQEDCHQNHQNPYCLHYQGLPSSNSLDRQRVNEKDESRLASKIRSLLGRGSSRTNNNSNRVFGVQLELVESYLDTGIPYIVYRLCNYLENHGFQSPSLFRLSGGSPKLTERLRSTFERKGDADLESVNCPSTAATLLRQYLKELPQPLVPSLLVSRLVHIHSQEYINNRESWLEETKKLLLTLPPSHYHLFGYLANYLSKYEAKHGCRSGVCGVFAPIILPHVPPATTLLRDILSEAYNLFPGCGKDSTILKISCKESTEEQDNLDRNSLFCVLKQRKRKERRESCCQERKLIRSNSEEQILENSNNLSLSIRRVSSHEDFISEKNCHIISHQEMGHGVRCSTTCLPLHERTNVSPVSVKPSPLPSPCDDLMVVERLARDVEHVRSTERFSRSITPRGRRQIRRRIVHKGADNDLNSSKENEDESDSAFYLDSPGANSQERPISQSFLEMLSSGPSRSPSPARALSLDNEDLNNPVRTTWNFQHRKNDEGENGNNLIEAMMSPRHSLLIPRRFYSENDEEETQNAVELIKCELNIKTLTKHINGLKKKIKKYEDEFEENFGYRPSHSDKMNNKDIKRLYSELNKLRKEHKMLKEDPIDALKAIANSRNNTLDNQIIINNNNSPEKSKAVLMEEMIKEIERKLSEKRIKYSRPDNPEDMTYEQLLDEKTAVQKALLHIESAFGRPVSKDDRDIVRSLYDKYRSLKRLIIRAGPNKNKDSISELATILEHEAMDFTSSSLPGNTEETNRRASEPDMSHRGILDCIDTPDQFPTDSDSQHSSSEGSRDIGESFHALSHNDLIKEQKIMREAKKRVRRTLKELEAQFEARFGRKMQREDRGPQIITVYESYKQVKAKLRLIDALLAKNA